MGKLKEQQIKFDELKKKFKGEFMQPEIIGPVDCVEAQTKHGESTFILAEYFDPADYPGCTFYTFSGRYMSRLSASGYLDCTEYTMSDSLDDAIIDLEQYISE